MNRADAMHLVLCKIGLSTTFCSSRFSKRLLVKSFVTCYGEARSEIYNICKANTFLVIP
jgi:hypothetical protein